MSILNRTSQVVIFDDQLSSNNPQRRAVDWRRSIQGVPVFNPRTISLTLDPLTEVGVFSGVRSLTADSSTEYALSISTIDSSGYRLKWTGVGAAPGFRTARNLAGVVAGTLTFTLQSNSTVRVVSSQGSVFGAVQIGDDVFIPGVTTGDASLFDPLNEGFWTVLSASATQLILAREPGTIFTGKGETVSITTSAQFRVFSASGVQEGDTLDVVSGFAVSTRNSYKISLVTSDMIEFTATTPIAEETVVAGTGISIYSAAKRYIFIESDQSVALKLNGSIDESNRLEPIMPGDPNRPGVFEKWGTCYSLSIKNRMTVPANITVVLAE